MCSCLKYSRIYRTVAVALVVAITCTAFPPPDWARVTVRVARAASLFDPAARGESSEVAQVSQEAASTMEAIAEALPEGMVTSSRRALPSASRLDAASSLSPPLSVSRLQSAYTPGDAISGTLVVTFTVTNNQPPTTMPEISDNATFTDTVAALESFDATTDPNAVHNVLLVDALTASATFVSANPRADYLPSPASGGGAGGGEYTWNLGSIPPMESLTATLTLQVPASVAEMVALDTGATAWGTLAGKMVSASACPATLAPATLGEYLQPTVDADFSGEYVAKRAGQLCSNPTGPFEYVRALGYEAYKGSLRGARGTEWSQAGNSLDQSNLLVAMLRGNGVPARYRHGTLSTERAQELILSMFPTTGAVVGDVPEDTETSDPANDPDLLAEAIDHWWVEAYVDGGWVAMDPSFSYAEPGQTFATPLPAGEGGPFSETPDGMRHKVTVSIEIERYDMLSYLSSGLEYETPLTYTFTTAELVGNPLTLEHLTSYETPPMGYMIYGWVYYTYVPYLRLGDNETVVIGHPFWELLSNYPFGQFAVTSEYLHFDVQDAGGNTTRYTRQIADRVKAGPRTGPLRQPRMVRGLMTRDVLSSLGPEAFPLVHQLDTHTIYVNPAWMSSEYAAHVGDDLLVTAPRIAEVRSVAASLGDLGDIFAGEVTQPEFGMVELAEMSDVVDGTRQAFNRMLGASFVTMSDWTSQSLADAGLVRAYPDAPRITIASSVISLSKNISQTTQLQVLDLLHDSVRAIAYPDQTQSAEMIYCSTRGVNETFLEAMVGDQFIGEESRSVANILQAATAQSIPLMYLDADHLDVLAHVEISTQAKAFIMDAVQQGYGIFVPERMVAWDGGQAIAWWQLDPETGEMTGVGENGTHQYLVTLTAEARVAVMSFQAVMALVELFLRYVMWHAAAIMTWNYWQAAEIGAPKEDATLHKEALAETKRYMANVLIEYPGWLS